MYLVHVLLYLVQSHDGSSSLPPPPPLSLSLAGNRFWLFREANLEPGYPQELVDYGRDIPYDRMDAAIWWEPSGYTYFFQGDW